MLKLKQPAHIETPRSSLWRTLL
uniref:Uncharacterized protein n=1 Tax=Arundo donax TaxID=35708 RepID=A0A0A9ASK1_ARUDO